MYFIYNQFANDSEQASHKNHYTSRSKTSLLIARGKEMHVVNPRDINFAFIHFSAYLIRKVILHNVFG